MISFAYLTLFESIKTCHLAPSISSASLCSGQTHLYLDHNYFTSSISNGIAPLLKGIKI